MKFIRKHKRSLLLVAVYLSLTVLYQLTNRPFGLVRILYQPLDDMIPFIPGFILVYHSWYPFIIAGMIAVFVRSERDFRLLLGHLVIAQALALLIFILFQTQVIRPEVTGTDIWSMLVIKTYEIDQPYNGFPSIHVLSSLIVAWHFGKAYGEKRWIGLLYWMYSGLIILSTLFVKQHMVWDLPGALAVGVISWIIIQKVYQAWFKEGHNDSRKSSQDECHANVGPS